MQRLISGPWGNVAVASRLTLGMVALVLVFIGCGGQSVDLSEDLGQARQPLQAFGFDEGPWAPNFITLPAGSTTLTGWTISGGGVDQKTTFWVHANGSRSLDLNALAPGAISAKFVTSPGYPVRVQFSMAGNPNAGPTVKRLRVEAAGQWQDYDFDITGRSTSNMGWTTKYFTYVPTSNVTVLTFRSLTDGAAGPAIDLVFPGTSILY